MPRYAQVKLVNPECERILPYSRESMSQLFQANRTVTVEWVYLGVKH